MKSVPAVVAAFLLLGAAACGGTTTGTASPATKLSAASLATSEATAPTPTATIADPSDAGPSTTGRSPSVVASPAVTDVTTPAGEGSEQALAELAGRMRAGIATTTSAKGAIIVYDGAAGRSTPIMSYQQQTDPDGSVVALTGDITAEDATQPFRWVDGRFFLGGETARLFEATWLEITSESRSPGLQDARSMFEDAMASSSMSQYVEYLAVAHDLVDGGPIQIGGVDLHWYVFVLDLGELDDVPMTESARDALIELRNQGLTRLGCEYRLDAEGRLHYVQLDLDDSAQPTSIVATYTDINVPADISVPDPSEIVVAP